MATESGGTSEKRLHLALLPRLHCSPSITCDYVIYVTLGRRKVLKYLLAVKAGRMGLCTSSSTGLVDCYQDGSLVEFITCTDAVRQNQESLTLRLFVWLLLLLLLLFCCLFVVVLFLLLFR